MVEAFVVVILIIVSLGTRGNLGASPEGLKESGFLSGPQPRCREFTASERRVLGNEPKGKASTYSMDGEFICERSIFEYGERDSFIDYVADVAPGRIAKAARRFGQLQESHPELAGTWTVRVVTDTEQVRKYVADLVRTEFAGYLKSGSISNYYSSPDDGSVIEVEIKRVQDADLLLTSSAVLLADGKSRRWSL